MSDKQEGPEWWLASDGRWYPPQPAPPPVVPPIPPVPPAPSSAVPPIPPVPAAPTVELVDVSEKPWWKKKRYNIPGGLLAAIIVIGIVAPPEEEPDEVIVTLVDQAAPADEPEEVLAEEPTEEPVTDPTEEPEEEPTVAPTEEPTQEPTETPPALVDVALVSGALNDLEALQAIPDNTDTGAYVRYDYQGNGWSDFDGDCRSTRHDVLAAESLIEPTFTANGCFVETGLWIDPWSGEEMTDASDAKIDHMIPLNEAHDSGAWEWDTDTKSRFTNDMDPAALNVVTQSTNSSKGRSSPADWRPPQESTWCGYALDWVRVKTAWQLGVRSSERDALRDMLGTCTEQSSAGPRVETLSVVAGVPLVVFAVPTPVPTEVPPTPVPPTPIPSTPVPGATPAPTAIPTAVPPPQDCSPYYPDFCIPSYPPDLNCGDVNAKRFTALAPDPHGFDGDGDGVACES